MKTKTVLFWLGLLFFISIACDAQTIDSIPKHDQFTIDSKQLGEVRVINVWIPLEYVDKQGTLPVLYMADGGLKEDFPHIANTLEQLISQKEIKPMMLVGIENTQRRRDLTGETKVKSDKTIAPVVGGSAAFRAFIGEELFPEIEKRYQPTAERGIIGESLAGLFVVETLLLQPEMFDFYIAFDPSLWWNNRDLIKNTEIHLAKLPAEKQKTFWFAGSGVKGMRSTLKTFVKKLNSANLPNLKWHYADEPEEEHSSIFRATKEKALIWTLGTE